MKIRNVGIVGCGIMGSGIAQLCAQKGYAVFVAELKERFLNEGLVAIGRNLEKLVTGGKLSKAEKENTITRIQGDIGLDHLEGCDLVIEADTEDLDLHGNRPYSESLTASKTSVSSSEVSEALFLHISQSVL